MFNNKRGGLLIPLGALVLIALLVIAFFLAGMAFVFAVFKNYLLGLLLGTIAWFLTQAKKVSRFKLFKS